MRTLEGRCIVLGVTGSIAAVETVRLIHALRRRGAEVQPVMSPAAMGIVHPDALTYASGREAITRCTGRVEHVMYCGEGGCADLLLIAPCTANTIGKIAAGIDDTPVTTFATTALGHRMPFAIAPAMHGSMYAHPKVKENLRALELWGIDVIGPRIDEGRAKIADTETIVLHAERALLPKPLKGKRVLVTSGACMEAIDDVRVLTTRSTGQMGRALALHAFRLGAEVTVVHSSRFPCVRNVYASSAMEMHREVIRLMEEESFDIYASAAAISDFIPLRREGKLPGDREVDIHLDPAPKLLREVADRFHPIIIAFKLGWNEMARAGEMLRQGIRMVVVNTPYEMGAEGGEFAILTEEGEERVHGTKEEVAAAIWQRLR
ncbi:MAG: bifunctional phosphopantothenoylcysteine decarboxylase/phosphopantothenate--cysteine ligase CoaBC [Methanomicrobiales archaeon]|nr:bifunctional phosphopantothenoylcysteine decarboxylase/phosphopantothenate--cysteine ligase CoaBC [Methanomicrobiales archaeon]